VRAYPRAMAKLRNQARKVKEVLSANSFIPVHVEAVHDDLDLATEVSRAQFEDMCHDLYAKVSSAQPRALSGRVVTGVVPCV
jgi:hypoxia up-regulated 1